MQATLTRMLGKSGAEPFAFGARAHARVLAPASRRAAALGVLGFAPTKEQPVPPLSLRQFLAVNDRPANGNALPDWADLRSLMIELAEAA